MAIKAFEPQKSFSRSLMDPITDLEITIKIVKPPYLPIRAGGRVF